MILSILGLIFVIIGTFYTYRTAKENGHNALFWTLTAFAVGFGVQIIIPLLIAIVFSIVLIASGRSVPEVQTTLQTPAVIIGVVCLIASVVGVVLILRKVSTVRDDEPLLPPPPDFYQNG